MQSISNLITFPCLKQIVGLIRVSEDGGQANIFQKEMIGKYIKYKMLAEVQKNSKIEFASMAFMEIWKII